MELNLTIVLIILIALVIGILASAYILQLSSYLAIKLKPRYLVAIKSLLATLSSSLPISVIITLLVGFLYPMSDEAIGTIFFVIWSILFFFTMGYFNGIFFVKADSGKVGLANGLRVSFIYTLFALVFVGIQELVTYVK